jgi:acyl-CoA thioester hydrolase
MPLIHERTFRIRHYECDAYGHVNNTYYPRYMQEAAFDASAAAGYDLARYASMGQHWLVRETAVDYVSPLRYGDSVVVKTWVEDFRRVRSRRAYELRQANSGQVAARGHTDWVFVDTPSGQPATIPPELIAAFFPEGVPPPAPARPRFPQPPPAPAGAFTMRRRVMWQDIDRAGHVNNAQYLAYISDCAFLAASAHGWPAARMLAEGFGIVVRRHHIEYRQPALMDDELEVTTWIYNVRRATLERAFTITRVGDGALVARVQALYVWINLDSGQPVRIGPDLLADFAENIAVG